MVNIKVRVYSNKSLLIPIKDHFLLTREPEGRSILSYIEAKDKHCSSVCQSGAGRELGAVYTVMAKSQRRLGTARTSVVTHDGEIIQRHQ